MLVVPKGQHVLPNEKIINKIKVLSVAGLFANGIRRIYSGESVGALFK